MASWGNGGDDGDDEPIATRSDEGMASGVPETFNMDAFLKRKRAEHAPDKG